MKLTTTLLILLSSFWLSGQTGLSYQIQKANGSIELNGRPDEAAWDLATVAGNFQMQSPLDGQPGSQATEVKMLYDDRFIYLSAICYDTNGFVTQTLKRDQPTNSDYFAVFIDPIGEKTNGYGFAVTAWNGQSEALVSQGDIDLSWDQRWYSSTQRLGDRWTLEMAIPFKSIRFKENLQTWRINFARTDPGAG